jgi:hypothetical protein
MPDSFFSAVLMDEQSFRLPPLGDYAVGMVFLPTDEAERNKAKCIMERVAAKLGHDSFTWRVVPTDNRSLGKSAVAVEPRCEQWFLSAKGIKENLDTEQQVRVRCEVRGKCGSARMWEVEVLLGDTGSPDMCLLCLASSPPVLLLFGLRLPAMAVIVCQHHAEVCSDFLLLQLFILRKFIEYELLQMGMNHDDVYFCSLSSATVVYKGQLTPEQVGSCARCCCCAGKGSWGWLGSSCTTLWQLAASVSEWLHNRTAPAPGPAPGADSSWLPTAELPYWTPSPPRGQCSAVQPATECFNTPQSVSTRPSHLCWQCGIST